MPSFAYWGTDEKGTEHRGQVDAAGLVEASAQLRARGILPSSLERVDREGPAEMMEEADAFAFFNRSLAEMTQLGFPLARAVGEVSKGLRRGKFKADLDRVQACLGEGKSLDEAVAGAGDSFPRYYRWMLKAGAASGNLPGVLFAIARNAEGIRRARRALVNALAYPALVLLFTTVLAAGFLTAFLPLYRDLQRMHGIKLSFMLTSLLAVSDSTALLAGGAAGVLALAVLLACWLRRTVSGERFVFRIPFLGRIRRNFCMARFLGCLGVLLRGKAGLVDALPLALGASGSLELERGAEGLRARAAEGAGLSGALKGAPVIPPQVVGYLALAERTGSPAQAADELADLLARQAAEDGEILYLVLFPAALAVTGGIVACLFVSLVLPYARLLEQIGR